MSDIWRHETTQVGICTVALFGELDMSGTHALRSVLIDAVNQPGVVGVHVDLARVGFIDSSGIAALVVAYRAAGDVGRRLRVVHPKPAVRRVLTVAGLWSVLSGDQAVTSPAAGQQYA